MSQLSVSPEALTVAAGALRNTAATLDNAHRAAMPSILDIAPAAADEVSAGVAGLFADHAQDYQAAVGQAAVFHEQFAQNLTAGSAAYLSVEDVIVALLQGVDAGVRAIPLAYASLVAEFIAGSNSWIELIPGPLRAFVVGVPFLSIFTTAVPFAVLSAILQATIAAFGG